MSSKIRPAILILAIGAAAFSLGYVVFPHTEGEAHGHAGSGTVKLDPGAAAPAFVVHDLDGNEVSSEELDGKIVVVDFWATWCGPCLTEIPHYNSLYEDYADQGVEMIGITFQSGSADQVEDWLSRPVRVGSQEFQIDYPIVMGNSDVEASWGPIWGFPMTFLLDSEWKIRKKWIGAVPMKTDQLRVLIDELLANQGQPAN